MFSTRGHLQLLQAGRFAERSPGRSSVPAIFAARQRPFAGDQLVMIAHFAQRFAIWLDQPSGFKACRQLGNARLVHLPTRLMRVGDNPVERDFMNATPRRRRLGRRRDRCCDCGRGRRRGSWGGRRGFAHLTGVTSEDGESTSSAGRLGDGNQTAQPPAEPWLWLVAHWASFPWIRVFSV